MLLWAILQVKISSAQVIEHLSRPYPMNGQKREMYILETERLTLRKFNVNDALFIVELLNTPGWLQFIGDRNVKSVNDAQQYLITGPMSSYKENGFGLSLVQRKENGIPIGMCGLLKRETLEYPDIGFAFLPQYQDKGYAYEIAAATLEYAADILQIGHICAITLPENQKSIKLLKKLQFVFARSFSSAKNGELLYQYDRKPLVNPLTET